MGRPPSVTRADVFRTADVLAASGRPVSASAVRKELGSGSLTTLQEHVTAWRAERQATPAAVPAALPPALSALLDDFEAQISALRTVISLYIDQAENHDVDGDTKSDTPCAGSAPTGRREMHNSPAERHDGVSAEQHDPGLVEKTSGAEPEISQPAFGQADEGAPVPQEFETCKDELEPGRPAMTNSAPEDAEGMKQDAEVAKSDRSEKANKKVRKGNEKDEKQLKLI